MGHNDLDISTDIAQSDEFWRHIFSTQQAGIIISVNSAIKEMNRTAMNMVGARSSAEIENKSFFDTILVPEYIQPAREREQSLRNGAASLPPMEIRIKRLDGGSIDALLSATSWIQGPDTIIESMLIDITSLKQRERLLEAVLKMMEITVRDDLVSSAMHVIQHGLNAMHLLYADRHNCGYMSFVHHETDFLNMQEATLSPAGELLISYEPLEEPCRLWLSDRARSISPCESCRGKLYKIPLESGNHKLILLVPFFYETAIIGCFFWIFQGSVRQNMIKNDSDRRDTFILAAFTAIKTFIMRQDNEKKTSDLAILHRIAIEIGEKGNLQQIADGTLELLAKERNWSPSVIRFKARHGEMLETVAHRGIPGTPREEDDRRIRQLNKVINRSKKGMIGAVIKTSTAIRSLDLPSDPRYVETGPGIKYGIYAPIIIESKTEGAIGVESASYAFTESDLQLISSIGEIVGMAVKSVRLIEALRERVSWLESLHRINQEIGVEARSEDLYQILVDKAVEATKAKSAALLIYNPEVGRLEKRAASGWLISAFQQPLRPDEGISGEVFTTGQPHLSPRLLGDPLLATHNRPAIPSGKANICVPVIEEGVVIGVFHLVMKAPAPFSREFVELVEMFGMYAGIVIGRMRRIDALRNAEENLQTAYDETLEGWARAIGIRDDETLLHTERVAHIAAAIGSELSLDPTAMENLRRGALLHDVGKIGIPDHILLKPGALSKEERQIMQTHASFGYELLKPIKYLEDALVVPYCHHERWDGTGYPRQLKDEEIPLLARVFAVADVYDAMTSNRPYRLARTPQEALEYIRAQSGKHFDPCVVEAFLEIIDRIDNEAWQGRPTMLRADGPSSVSPRIARVPFS